MINRIVFRADTRAPATIFAEGFLPKHGGGIKITPGAQMSGGVSTSKDLGVAIRYAALYDGWVFVAWLDQGVDVLGRLAQLGHKAGFKNAMSQMEIAARKIPGADIIAARRCRQTGEIAEMHGDVVYNEHCTVGIQHKLLAKAFLACNATVAKDYAH